MDVEIVDINGNDALIEKAMQALRTVNKPWDWTGGGKKFGHYRLTAISGTIAASLADASELFAARWGASDVMKVLTRIAAAVGVYTAAQTVANPLLLELVAARAWTVDHAANNTAITPANNSQKMRSDNMGTSLYSSDGKVQICTTTGMTGATKTFDTAGMGLAMFPGNALGIADTKDLYNLMSSVTHPFVARKNEGIILRNSGAFGAAATYKLGVVMEWIEVFDIGG